MTDMNVIRPVSLDDEKVRIHQNPIHIAQSRLRQLHDALKRRYNDPKFDQEHNYSLTKAPYRCCKCDSAQWGAPSVDSCEPCLTCGFEYCAACPENKPSPHESAVYLELQLRPLKIHQEPSSLVFMSEKSPAHVLLGTGVRTRLQNIDWLSRGIEANCYVWSNSDRQPEADSTILRDGSDHRYCLDPYPSGQSPHNSMISLKNAIANSMIEGVRKYELACLLVQSFLQLYKSPWLGKNWPRDLYFQQPRYDSSETLGKLYIVTKLDAAISAGHEEPESAHIKDSAVRRHEDLFKLGVVLIELWHQIPKEVEINKEELLEMPDMLDYVPIPEEQYRSASKACDELASLSSDSFVKAVRQCIECNFVGSDEDLRDPNFEEDIYHGVYVPLYHTYDELTAGSGTAAGSRDERSMNME